MFSLEYVFSQSGKSEKKSVPVSKRFRSDSLFNVCRACFILHVLIIIILSEVRLLRLCLWPDGFSSKCVKKCIDGVKITCSRCCFG